MTRKTLSRTTLAAVFAGALVPATAGAASFQILEQSPSLQGTSFAGTASAAADASTVFFNPAGMAMLDGAHATAGGNLILPVAEFDNDGSTNPGGSPLSGPDDETDKAGFVPNFYYVRPLEGRWTFGFGVNAPFGLASSYDKDWVGRYHATDSELSLINVNPTFAYRASEAVSLGIGLSYQRIDATLENEVDSAAVCFGTGIDTGTCAGAHGGFGNRASDSSATIEGDDDAVTLDLSVLFITGEGTRVGAVYRHGGNFTLEGNADFDQSASCIADPRCNGALTGLEGNIEADVDIPGTMTLSVTHMLDDRWTLHGDLAWTGWGSIDQIEIVNTDNGRTVSTLDLAYEDTMRLALGTSYHDGGPWTWRGGIALDQAPQTDPAHQTPRVPDEHRTWLSFGFNYARTPSSSIDFGYTHILVDDIEIDNTNGQGHTLTGDFDASVDILALQGNWRF